MQKGMVHAIEGGHDRDLLQALWRKRICEKWDCAGFATLPLPLVPLPSRLQIADIARRLMRGGELHREE
jgi:hypothetical protein